MKKNLLFSFLFVLSCSLWADSSEQLLRSFGGNEDLLGRVLRNQIGSASEANSVMTYEVRMKEVKKLDSGLLAEFVPVIDQNKSMLVMELQITPEGLKNPAVVAEEILRMNQIISGQFTHPYQWAETVANARAGSPAAIEKLARLDVRRAEDIKGWLETNINMFDPKPELSKIEEFAKARIAEAEARYKPLRKAAEVYLRQQGAEWEKMRPKFDQLEKLDKKLNDLIMANDRAGVRKLIETYTPWPLMEPTEKNAWRQWLEAIEHPNRASSSLVFRGMDGYPVLKTPGKEEVGMVSTVLSRNQGNYTRRLRSLTTARERGGRTGYDWSAADEANPKKFPKDQPSVLVQMQSHATDPVGSPFISVSDHEIAARFGMNERMALLVDDRRLVPNGMSLYGEAEKLIPLVVFPDEVVLYEKGTEPINTDEFIKKVSSALGRDVKPNEISSGEDNAKLLKKGFDRFTTLIFDSEGKIVKTPGCIIGKPCNCVRTALSKLLNE
jgi:hypothetical protein